MSNFYPPDEISPLGEFLAACHFGAVSNDNFPIDPEIIAAKYFGLDIQPRAQLMSIGVKSGIDTTQSVIFIDEGIYLDDRQKHLSNQSVAHELGHAIFDVASIRQMASASIDDAFERHNALIKQVRGIEQRANILSGSFLVPRAHLIKQTSLRLAQNYDRAMSINPQMTMEQVIKAMASSQLARYFCQSDLVLSWRFDQENIYEALLTQPGSTIETLDLKHIRKLADMPYKPVPISERVKALLPEELLAQYRLQFSLT